MSGYLTVSGINAALQYLVNTYPALCQMIVLPEPSIERRTIRAIKIASGGGRDRHGVLFLGGVHARELVNPDLLVSFALNVCRAFTTNTGLTFGGKTYEAFDIRLIVETEDIFIVPVVNPDGREYVQSPSGDAWWRKNRNPNPGLPCQGVDINRNFDLLWSSGIGTSAYSCNEVFKGAGAFSEPETRNVRWLLDEFANICCMIDIHSYSQDILYPWGDGVDQTTDPSMNFMNPAYNGLRGTSTYKEYIPYADLDWYQSTGTRLRNAIGAVRGTPYILKQSIGLYPTTGTSDDYAFSRHFVDASKRRVHSYTIETGLEFQPAYSEALHIIEEVSAGLIEFCLACICSVDEIVRGTGLQSEVVRMQEFRDRDMQVTSAGRRYARLLEEHTVEIMQILTGDDELRDRVLQVLERVNDVAQSTYGPEPRIVDAGIIQEVQSVLDAVADRARPSLRRAIAEVREDGRHFEGRTVIEGLRAASGAEGRAE